MNMQRILAILLIAAGVMGLAYGGFTYNKTTHEAQIGTLEISVQEKQSVDVPIWAGVAAIGAGAALLLFGARKR